MNYGQEDNLNRHMPGLKVMVVGYGQKNEKSIVSTSEDSKGGELCFLDLTLGPRYHPPLIWPCPPLNPFHLPNLERALINPLMTDSGVMYSIHGMVRSCMRPWPLNQGWRCDGKDWRLMFLER